MSKKNKWTIVPFIVIAFLILALLYYLTIRKPSAPSEPLKAIPPDAALIIKINDFRTLYGRMTQDNAIWNELRTIPAFHNIDRQLHFLDSLYSHVPEAQEIFENPPSFLSAHFSGHDNISVMHVIQLPAHYSQKKIIELVTQLIARAGTVKSRNYDGVDLYEVALLKNSTVKNFSFTVYHNLFIVSFSSLLLEDAIRQLLTGESITSLSGFNKIYTTAGKNVVANVFINFEHFPRSLSAFVKPEYKAEVRSFKNFAGWAEFDINVMSDMVLLNGFVSSLDSVPSIASLFLKQSPQRVTADQILPASVASFLTTSISNIEKYITDYQALLKDEGLLGSYNNTLTSLNNAYGTNLPGDILDLLDNEITLAFDAADSGELSSGTYILLRVKSQTQAEERLNSILEKIARTESKPVSSFITAFKLDAESTYNIYHMPIRKFAAKIFGNLYAAVDDPYYVILDNYIIFSNSEQSLKSLIHSHVLNKTLLNDMAYKEFKDNLSPKSNLCFYCNLNKGQGVYAAYLNKSISQTWLKFLPVFQKLQVCGLQLNTNGNMLYGSMFIKHLSSFNTTTQTVWESKLDTLVVSKPVFVMNHQTQQNEVFVQDLKNNIYLINQVGRVLWKIQLNERINSEIFQIDYFRNGKLQLLFSTRSALYLIDRNGNNVEKYPVKLRSPATNGVSVFDYDNNREYRLFIACEDKHVYAYMRDGSILSGWKFGQSESEVTQPVNYFKIGDKDFLVFGDRYKTYILDRKGNTRINVDNFFPKSSRNSYMLDIPRDGKNPSIVTSDTAGKVYFIGFDGKVTTFRPPSDYTNHHFFDLKDLNGDGNNEYIFLEGANLTVLNKDGSTLFTYRFDEPVLYKPIFYQFSATDRKLGIVLRNKNLIYLINGNGKPDTGFPLQGNTPFSIGNFGDTLSRFNLVVGSRDNFLYNYRVK
jgi:hypothetical protein